MSMMLVWLHAAAACSSTTQPNCCTCIARQSYPLRRVRERIPWHTFGMATIRAGTPADLCLCSDVGNSYGPCRQATKVCHRSLQLGALPQALAINAGIEVLIYRLGAYLTCVVSRLHWTLLNTAVAMRDCRLAQHSRLIYAACQRCRLTCAVTSQTR